MRHHLPGDRATGILLEPSLPRVLQDVLRHRCGWRQEKPLTAGGGGGESFFGASQRKLGP